MTWIVGMPTLWGYGIGISDIRITLADGSEHDCLQKIYPIANSIALGFAGSVKIGFTMVSAMRQWLHCDESDRAWHPLESVELWPEIARAIFKAAHPDEQQGHCHLLMLSADPVATNGMGPKTYVHIFRSPDFMPVEIPIHKAAGIGSGNFIEEYAHYLDEISNDYERNFNLIKMEAGTPGGMGGILGFTLTEMIKRTNPTGISSHLHYCWVYLGKTIIKTNDHMTIGNWTALEGGSGVNQPDTTKGFVTNTSKTVENATTFKMPEIAQSWSDLLKVLKLSEAQILGSVT